LGGFGIGALSQKPRLASLMVFDEDLDLKELIFESQFVFIVSERATFKIYYIFLLNTKYINKNHAE